MRFLAVAMLVGSSIPALAQGAAGWTADSIKSSVLNATRRVRISLPLGYSNESEQSRKYPVAIVLDAEDALFTALLPSLRLLESGVSPALPPLIVVGVVSGRTRAHDMHPPASPGMGAARQNAGGAEKFNAFLEQELLPWVRAKYRTLPYTVLAGHSSAGHFALYAFGHSTVYQAAIAVSPALFWLGPDTSDEKLSQEYSDLIRRNNDPRRLYVGVGAYDPANIRRGTKTFVDQLGRPPASLSFRYSVLENDNHQTARQSGLMEGFRWVFDPVSLGRNRIYQLAGPNKIDTTAFRRAYEETKATYAAGARSLRFPESLPASFLNAWARNGGGPSYADRMSPIVTTICADYIRWYPEDPGSHECAADLALAKKDSATALREYRASAAAARAGKMTEMSSYYDQVVATLDSALSRRKPPR